MKMNDNQKRNLKRRLKRLACNPSAQVIFVIVATILLGFIWEGIPYGL